MADGNFTGAEGTRITRTVAKAMIQLYQQEDYFKMNKIKGGFFGKNILLSILNQDKCVGIRYYYALNNADEHTLVLVGEDSDGTILSDGVLTDEGPLCPPWCGKANAPDS